jgi:photosystem II stability/assembly factor-like uncharacterized protein
VAQKNGQAASGDTPAASGSAIDPALLGALEWRAIGPFRGGRVVAVAGDPVNRQVFYFGSTGGGVWKTTDGGVYWENVSDGFFKRASVGGLAVAPSDPNVIYAGMGESTIRGNVSHGDGVYRSTDAGKTWVHLGLAGTRNIARVRVHPHDPDLVYVAALGHAHGPNAERGVYRSRDGGQNWERILFRDEDVGAYDLSLDPNNPRILYATLWRARRLPHALESGGEGCGLFKSTDGGDTWTELTRNKGLPTGTLGKIGVAVSPARPERVWAIVEAENGAVFRSDDGGQTWERLSDERDLRSRPWYYQHIHAHPQDPDTLWVLNVRAYKSTDGGKTFFQIGVPHGDNHDLWIDPRDPNRMIEGNDGGACVTFNGGDTWSSLYNQPTGEFYHVIADTQVPYHLYGAQQDNTTIRVPSRSRNAAITQSDCQEIGGGESGYIAVRPDNPSIVYAGSYLGYLSRYDDRTGQRRDISVWPEVTTGWAARDAKYRFQWTFPIVLSPHDPSVLYTTGNLVFRSTDEGSTWEAISPDLTRHDDSRLGLSGGPITKDNTGTEYYATIFAFAESPLRRGLLWAGSDDGLVHVSRDGGQSWENVTPAELPEWALISIIEPSPHDPAVAYVAANRYKLDDFVPYLFKTDDYGKHWTKITSGIAADDFTRAIREDPERRGLLYAGTETGVHVSFDDGWHWQSLRLNLPAVPIHDLVVVGSDLAVATHGRGLWILDDLTPLRQMHASDHDAELRLFAPRPTNRFWTDHGYPTPPTPGITYGPTGAWITPYRRSEKPTGESVEHYLDAGQNPRDGVYVTYSLKEKPEGEVKLTFLDASGREIKTFSSVEPPEPAPAGAQPSAATATEPPVAPAEQKPAPERKDKYAKKEPRVPKEAGANRFVWDMRYPDPHKISGYVAPEDELSGPLAPPGAYQVRLSVGERTATAPFEIRKDPRVPATQEDLDAQFALLIQIRDKISATHDAINTIRNVRKQVEEWEQRTEGQPQHDAVTSAGTALKAKLAAIEEELTQVKAKNRQDTLDYPIKLNVKLSALSGIVASADAAPTRQSREVFAELAARVDEQLGRLRQIVETDLAAFNAQMRDASVPAVVPSAAAWASE